MSQKGRRASVDILIEVIIGLRMCYIDFILYKYFYMEKMEYNHDLVYKCHVSILMLRPILFICFQILF